MIYLTRDHTDEGQSHYGETLKQSQPLLGFPISHAIYSILQSAPKQLLICNLASRHLNIKYNNGEPQLINMSVLVSKKLTIHCLIEQKFNYKGFKI